MMSDTPKKKKCWWKRRWVVWCLWVPTCFILVLVGTYYWATWREMKRWEATQQMVVDRGQSLDFRDYLQAVDSENLNALDSPEFQWLMDRFDSDSTGGFGVLFGIDHSSNEMTYIRSNWEDPDPEKGLTLLVAQDFENEAIKIVSNDEAARAMLDSVASQTELLQKVDALLGYPVWQDPEAYEHENPMDVYNNESDITMLCRWFMRRAAMHFQLNEPEEGLLCLENGFRTVEWAHEQRSLLGALVEVSNRSMFLNALWQGLALERFDDKQLRRIDALMTKLPSMEERIIESLYAETAFGVNAMKISMNEWTAEDWEEHFSNPLLDIELTWMDHLALKMLSLPFGYYRNQRLIVETRYAVLKTYEEMTPKPRLTKLNDYTAAESKARISNPFDLSVHVEILAEEMLVTGFGAFLDGVSMSVAYWDIGRSQVAVARFKLEHGHYPSGFSDLVPEYLDDVPADPFDRKPLRWTEDESGKPLIYSIGPDLVDSGGAVLDDDDQGDVRWLMTIQGINTEYWDIDVD